MSSDDYNEWVDQVNSWKNETYHVPAVVSEDIAKGRYSPTKAKHAPRSTYTDPLSVQYAMGYKDRAVSLTYDTLKKIPHQLSVVGAILNTRCNQVAQFSTPFRLSKSIGYAIRHKNTGRMTTRGERKFIQDLEQFIYNCGSSECNQHSDVPREDFETFLKKIVRDSLMFDQACAEVVPDRRGLPFEFMAVDASTMRIAVPETLANLGIKEANSMFYADQMRESGSPFKLVDLCKRTGEDAPAYVQVVNGQIENIYSRSELCFGVRNPRTDIYVQGYGYSELEQLITVITSHLYAEEYNRKFFVNGSAPKGILNLRGDNLTPDQLEGLRRQWRANIEGVQNSWKTPIFQTEQGVDWINLHPSNREMEYGAWLEYLIKVTTAVFLIDPAEVNFDLKGGVQQQPLFESSAEWKLKASRDRGLKPLLRFIAKMINQNIISKIDDHFVFDFVGLDELTEHEKHELRKEQVASYMTLNEIRRAEDLPDVVDGDYILNPTYMQVKQLKLQERQIDMQEEQQKAMALQQEQLQQQMADQVQEGGSEDAESDEPEYADTL